MNGSGILFPAMAESPGLIEIPRRALFKAAEVCELVHVQPYVLRSWESEFPKLRTRPNLRRHDDTGSALFGSALPS